MQSEKPSWQSKMQRTGTALLTMLFAAGITLVIGKLLQRPFSLIFGFALFLFFLGLWLIFYALWYWFFFEHPAENAKKLPISSKELRRRTKAFYDNLSQRGNPHL
jgi:hypothetical protein